MTSLIAERLEWVQAPPMPVDEPEGIQRAARLAEIYLVPILVIMVMLVDIAAGINWAFAGTVRLSGPSYRVARETGPIWHLGVIMLAMVVLKVYVMLKWERGWFASYAACAPLAGAWGFWSVVFGLAPLGVPNTSYIVAIFSVFMMLMHILLALLLSRSAKV